MARSAQQVDRTLRVIAAKHGKSTAELREVYVESVRAYRGDGDSHLWGVANAYGHALGNRTNLVRVVEAFNAGSITSGVFNVRDAMFLKGAGGRFIGSRSRDSQAGRMEKGRAVRSSKAGSYQRARLHAERRVGGQLSDGDAYRTDPMIDVRRSLGSRTAGQVARTALDDVKAEERPRQDEERQLQVDAELPEVVIKATEAGVGPVDKDVNPVPDPSDEDLEVLGGHPDTQHKYVVRFTENGMPVYSDERAAEHEFILNSFFKGKTPPVLADGERPLAFFMAGGAASGKSSIRAQEHFDNLPKKPDGSSPTPEELALFLDNKEGDVMSNTIIINPDLIKEMLPEYKDLADSGSLYAATGVHEESSDLAKELQRRAMELGFHVVIDGTGDSGEDKMGGKLMKANEQGYDVSVAVVTISTGDAILRAWNRFESGVAKFESGESENRPRMVPVGIIMEQHESVSDYFHKGGSRDPRLAEGFHSLPFIKSGMVYDNSGPPGTDATPIARFDNGELVKLDEFLYEKFIEKENGMDLGGYQKPEASDLG